MSVKHYMVALMLWLPLAARAQVPPAAIPPANPATPPASSPASGNPVAPAVPPMAPLTTLPATGAEPENKFSYGDAPYSLFYTPKQIEQMKIILTDVETALSKQQPIVPKANLEVIPERKRLVAEPVDLSNYPMFYLSSVVYHTPSNWTVWLEQSGAAPAPVTTPGTTADAKSPPAAGAAPAPPTMDASGNRQMKITPKNNTGDLVVTRVGEHVVEFVWRPTYTNFIATRTTRQLFAKSDTVRHRLALNPTITYAPGDKEIHFALRENQSFVPGYFKIFEGRVPNPPLDPLSPTAPTVPSEVPQAAVEGTPAAPAGAIPDNESIDSLLARAQKQDAEKAAAAKAAAK